MIEHTVKRRPLSRGERQAALALMARRPEIRRHLKREISERRKPTATKRTWMDREEGLAKAEEERVEAEARPGLHNSNERAKRERAAARRAEDLEDCEGKQQHCLQCGKVSALSTARHWRHNPGCKHFTPEAPGVSADPKRYSKLALAARYGRA